MKPHEKYTLHTIKKTVRLSVTLPVYLCFNNVWSKHYRLRDSKLAKRRSASGRLGKKLNKNKPRVDYEQRSAHGREVNLGSHTNHHACF